MPGLIDQSGDTGLAFTAGGGLQVQAAIGGGSLIVQPVPSWLPVIDGVVPAMGANFENGELWITDGLVPMTSNIICSRASTGWAETLSGDLMSFLSNVLRRTDKGLLSEPASTNVINSAMTGVDVGTNTMPTGWSANTPIDDLTRTVVGTGTEAGRPYVDIRWSGTSASAGTTSMVLFTSNTANAALNTETWTASLDAALVGGSLTNVSTMVATIRFNNAAGTQLSSATVSIMDVAATRKAYAVTATASNALTAWASMSIVTNFANTSAVDFTLRFYVPQLEKSPVRTSPIIGAANTLRAADNITMTGASFSDWYSQTEGTFVFDGDVGNAASRSQYSVSNNTANEDIRQRTTSGFATQWALVDGAVTQVNIAGATYSGTQTALKSAFAYKLNDCAVSYNGGAALAAASATMPTVNRLDVGGWRGTEQNGLYIRRLAYFNTRRPDAQLPVIST